MEGIREALATAKDRADEYFNKTTALVARGANLGVSYYKAAKKRSKRFFETGVIHYQQTEETILDEIRNSFAWIGKNQTYAYVALGTTAVVVVPGLRRMVFRNLLRPWRSDEAIFRSAEERLESVKMNFQKSLKDSDAIEKTMESAFEEYRAACRKIKSTSSELGALSGRLNRDIRSTQELMMDMRELPSRPSLKMQSEAAMQLKELQQQSRHLDNLQYKILQKGF